jgi:translation initiation factor 2 subunit 1
MLYYGKKLPLVDDVVFVYVSEFSTNGTYCKLIEYDDREGFILNTELDKRVYDPKKVFEMGEIYPMSVLSSTDTGIDLSYKKIKSDTRKDLLFSFSTIQKICTLVKEFTYLTKIPLPTVLENTTWKIFDEKRLVNSKEIYLSILRNPSVFTGGIEKNYPDETKTFLENLSERITTTNMVVHQNFDLMICDEDSVSKLKEVLTYDEEKNTQVKYVSSPKYQIVVTGSDEGDIDQKIEKCLNHMKSKMKSYTCIFNIGEKLVIKQKEFILKPLYMPDEHKN